MGLLDYLFGNKKNKERLVKQRLATEQPGMRSAYSSANRISQLLQENPMPCNAGSCFNQDLRTSFYDLDDIKVMSMGPSVMLAPYDAYCYEKFPDASVLPLFANTEKIKKFMPGLGFDNEESAKKRLESLLVKAEEQLGVTYVIRVDNIPAGMIFVNSPLYNKKTINLSIWTVEFYISELAEHQGVMYNSLARVLNVMKNSMAAKFVYAMVDETNTDCINLIDKGLFTKVDNSGFANNGIGGKKPLVYMIDLTKIRFERR